MVTKNPTAKNQSGLPLLQVLQGVARRKNCCGPDMIFVTVYCPLTTTGAMETVAQTVGAKKFVVDCKVNPALLVGHAKTIEFCATAPEPAGLTITPSMGGELEGVLDTKVGENAAVLSPALPSVKSIPPM
jgi:hypothetical protein